MPKKSRPRPRRPEGPRYTRRPKPTSTKGERPPSGKQQALKIIPLGGNEETGGRNMYLVQWRQEILIIDIGLQFPEEDMPGVDYIIPDASYLKGKERWVRGVIITHGHYDHIGGAPHLLPRLGNPPVYASDLTCAMLQKKMEDVAPGKKMRLNTVKTRDRVRLGSFRVEFFGLSHNIPGSLGVIVETPAGTVVHTGDFKLDTRAHIMNRTDLEVIQSLGHRHVLCLMCDSTNATTPGHQLSEADIEQNIQTMFTQTRGRMIFATFASLLSRIQQILTLAEKYNRRVLVEGYSMRTNIEIGQQLGYIRVKPHTILPWEEIKKLPKDRVLVMCTGAQGEDNAVLMRIANREHKYLRVEPDDLIIFSSSVVPGNERSVERLKDGLYREGADIIDYKMLDIHAGGHANAGDIVDFIRMVRPKYLMPIEGSFSHLVENKKNAIKAGIPAPNILLADNGQTVEFVDGRGFATNQRLPIEYVFVDGLGIGDVNHIVLRDRKQLADEGMIIAVAQITHQGKIQGVDIISRGFTHMKEQGRLIHEMAKEVRRALDDKELRTRPDSKDLREKVHRRLEKFIFQKTHRQPMILPVIVEV
ncbi:MAG: ribonuclease J [Candidatus Kerfeldbacteria bacterium]|nr:ribonuclease J [Candidatus Kerfeldbacteria bacterium]